MAPIREGFLRAKTEKPENIVHPRLLLQRLRSSGETWTLTGELRRRRNSFGTILLRRILGYRWHNYGLVLREADLRQVTCIVRERQVRLYGHVARLPAEDPAHRILPC